MTLLDTTSVSKATLPENLKRYNVDTALAAIVAILFVDNFLALADSLPAIFTRKEGFRVDQLSALLLGYFFVLHILMPFLHQVASFTLSVIILIINLSGIDLYWVLGITNKKELDWAWKQKKLRDEARVENNLVKYQMYLEADSQKKEYENLQKSTFALIPMLILNAYYPNSTLRKIIIPEFTLVHWGILCLVCFGLFVLSIYRREFYTEGCNDVLEHFIPNPSKEYTDSTSCSPESGRFIRFR